MNDYISATISPTSNYCTKISGGETRNKIKFVEGTTRYVNVKVEQAADSPIDLSKCRAQTYINLNGSGEGSETEEYLETKISDGILSFVIPAEVSVGMGTGITETRLFMGEVVESVLMCDVIIIPSPQPSTEIWE